MADLRIADAPELSTSAVEDGLKVPTGGFGNYSITMLTIADWLLNYKNFATKSYVDNSTATVNQSLINHVNNTNNPHSVTKSQVGLGNVNNTADLDKPISDATAAALALKADKSNTYTKTDVDDKDNLKADKTYVDTQLGLKADKTNTYTKNEVDNLTKYQLDGTITPNISAAWGAVPQIKKLTGDVSPELNAQSKVLLQMLNDVRKNGGAMPFVQEFADAIGGFDIGDEVKLSDGTKVISTIPNNTNDPNVNITGWVSASIDNRYSSISKLRSSNETRSTVYIDNYTLSDGRVILCGGLFKLDSSDNTSSDDTALTIVTSNGARYKRILPTDGEYQIDWWFDPATDQDDYSLTFQRCANFTKSSNHDDTAYVDKLKYVTFVGSGGIRYFKSGVTLWIYRNTWDFRGMCLDFTQVADDTTAVWLRNANNSNFKNVRIQGKWSKSNITVNSDGTYSVKDNSIGLYLHTNAPNIYGTAVSSTVFDGVNVYGFKYPIRYGNNAYIHKWTNGTLGNYFAGLSAIDNPQNTGENITFDFFNITDGVLYMKNWIQSKHHKCSFDYSGLGDSSTATAFKSEYLFSARKLDFSDCHFEWGNSNSIFYGSVMKCDDVQINDGTLWLSTTDLTMLNHPYFCEATDLKKATLIINGFEATNTMWNGYGGAWGNGQRVTLDKISPTTVGSMWKNFWKSPSKSYGDYTNSMLTGMNLDSTSAGTATNAYNYYIASTRLQTDANGDKKILTYDATANSLTAKSYLTDKNGSMYIYLYADSIPNCVFNASMAFFASDASIASDKQNPTISLNISEGWLDSSGSYVKMQDLIYPPTAKDGDQYVHTDGINVANRPLSTNKSNKIRLEILISNFYVTGTNNEYVAITFRCPRLESVGVLKVTNNTTV